ncbi:serine/threonine-protein kinase [Glycomyces salinus]|uniref:serine/threonine-protein kinase n=1 Tax=Glycomyces salinus TaxID=980294 RepID=UPI0018EE2FA2|nr:serine/threonine-protein kinase [Glycomyces salinus]
MRQGRKVGGRYRLDERLGSGGHGEVWRATDTELDRTVALKRALSDADDADSERLRSEARTAAKVNHPNVVAVHDVIRDGDDWWLVMEYIPGGRTLAELGRLAPDRAAEIAAQLADALAAVHREGILHRDLKPGNILVAADDRAKLADFGISRLVYDAETITVSGRLAGTPGYLAPEVADGGRFTKASDVFSLGATLFEAIEGASPFGRGNQLARLRRTIKREIDAPRRAGGLEQLLSSMLDFDPKRRPGAGEAAETLGKTPVSEPRAALLTRRNLAWSGGSAAIAVAAAVALVYWNTGGAPGEGTADGGTVGQQVDLIGEAVTADPCALLDPDDYTDYGEARFDTDQGIFNSCDVVVDLGQDEVDVEVDIWRTSQHPPSGQVEMIGQVGVVRLDPEAPEICERQLVLPDGRHLISIDAAQDRGRDVDLCAMADLAVGTALDVLEQGQIPRREDDLDPSSLISLSACDLLGNDELELFPGIDATHPVVNYGEWECNWGSTTRDYRLRILFQRSDPLTAEEGEPITLGGREAYLQRDRWTDDSCLVSIVHRQGPSADGDGTTTAELVRLLVYGDAPNEELCEMALDLAEPAAAALAEG